MELTIDELRSKIQIKNGNKIIFGNVKLKLSIISEHLLPEWLSDVIIEGDFDCSYNGLATLRNAPKSVWSFDCSHNHITVFGDHQDLAIYIPKLSRDKNFNCSHNDLISLKGVPEEVGNFNCSHNYRLSSLKGGPTKVGGHYNCSHNNLRSLKGAPKYISGDFDCRYNKLNSLDDIPFHINGDLICNPMHTSDGLSNRFFEYDIAKAIQKSKSEKDWEHFKVFDDFQIIKSKKPQKPLKSPQDTKDEKNKKDAKYAEDMENWNELLFSYIKSGHKIDDWDGLNKNHIIAYIEDGIHDVPYYLIKDDPKLIKMYEKKLKERIEQKFIGIHGRPFKKAPLSIDDGPPFVPANRDTEPLSIDNFTQDERKFLSNYVASENVELILDGKRFLLEKGDVISILPK